MVRLVCAWTIVLPTYLVYTHPTPRPVYLTCMCVRLPYLTPASVGSAMAFPPFGSAAHGVANGAAAGMLPGYAVSRPSYPVMMSEAFPPGVPYGAGEYRCQPLADSPTHSLRQVSDSKLQM